MLIRDISVFVVLIFCTKFAIISCTNSNNSLKYGILNIDNNNLNLSTNFPHDYFKIDAEKVDEKSTFDQKKQNQIMSMMRNLLKKEIRKIKSSMTDSIMEEVNV